MSIYEYKKSCMTAMITLLITYDADNGKVS